MNGVESQVTYGDQLDLREFLDLLLSRKWLILGTALLSTAAFTATALFMTPIYRVSSVLVPATAEGGLGGLGAAMGQLGGLAALAGVNLSGGQDPTEEALAVLASQEFTQRFISHMDLLPKLFESKWDPGKGAWKVPESQVPSLAAGAKRFSNHVRHISRDRKTGLVTLSIDWRDREEAVQWNRKLVEMINDEMRGRAVSDAERYIAYLENELRTTELVETRLAISRLLDAQIKQRMMARVTREFAFRTVDPGMVPDAGDVLRPKKMQLFALGPIVGLTLGVGYVLLAWVFGGTPSVRRRATDAAPAGPTTQI